MVPKSVFALKTKLGLDKFGQLFKRPVKIELKSFKIVFVWLSVDYYCPELSRVVQIDNFLDVFWLLA